MGYGYQWLTILEQALKDEGFRVERGYSGKGAVFLTEPALSLNLTRMDTQSLTVEATATVMVPRKMGLDHCQKLAEKVTRILAQVGGDWKFQGWKMDTGRDCFLVEVVGKTRYESDFQVLIGEVPQECVTNFLSKQLQKRRLIRPHGQQAPVGITPGLDGWFIRLTQVFPAGFRKPEPATEPFDLTVIRGNSIQIFRDCCWSDFIINDNNEGTKVIRNGFALTREVSSRAANGV